MKVVLISALIILALVLIYSFILYSKLLDKLKKIDSRLKFKMFMSSNSDKIVDIQWKQASYFLKLGFFSKKRTERFLEEWINFNRIEGKRINLQQVKKLNDRELNRYIERYMFFLRFFWIWFILCLLLLLYYL